MQARFNLLLIYHNKRALKQFSVIFKRKGNIRLIFLLIVFRLSHVGSFDHYDLFLLIQRIPQNGKINFICFRSQRSPKCKRLQTHTKKNEKKMQQKIKPSKYLFLMRRFT